MKFPYFITVFYSLLIQNLMLKITSILFLILSITAFGQRPKILDIQGDCDAAVETTTISDGRQCSANHNWTAAVDIIVPADKNLTLNSITPSLGMQPGTTATSVLVSFYNNANGVPGNLIGTPQTITPTSSAEINVSQLNEGTYLLKVNIDGEIGTYKFLKN